jgi:hypothetical protein
LLEFSEASNSTWPPVVEYVRFVQSVTVTAFVALRSIGGMLTYWRREESAEIAVPSCPAAQPTPFTNVADWPFGDESAAVAPEASSKVHLPTGLGALVYMGERAAAGSVIRRNKKKA